MAQTKLRKGISITLSFVIFFLLSIPTVYAVEEPDEPEKETRYGTILPESEYQKLSDCEKIMMYVNTHIKDTTVEVIFENEAGEEEVGEETIPGVKSVIANRDEITDVRGIDGPVSGNDILGCAIMTGDIKLWMVPFYIRYFLEFVIGIAGLISVGAVIYGGYNYLFAGISEDKEKGKNAIKNGIIGLVLTLTAWGIVNIVIGLVSR